MVGNVCEVVKKESFAFWMLSIVLLKFAYDIAYYCVADGFGYYGFQYNPSGERFLIAWLITIVSVPFCYRKCKKFSFSTGVILIFYFVNFLPGLTLYEYMNDTPFISEYILYFFMLCFFDILIPKFYLSVKPNFYVTDYMVGFVGSMLACAVFGIWVYFSNCRIDFNIWNVYSARAESRSYDIPLIIKYIYSGMKVAVLPMLIAWCFDRRKWILGSFFCLSMLVAFFVDGAKGTLFMLMLTLLVVFFLRNNIGRIWLLPFGLLCIVLVSDLLYRVGITTAAVNLLLRRMIFEPSLINYYYHDFFTLNEPDYFAQSIFRFVGLVSNYDISIANLIGLNYYGSVTNGANNGLFSDAFMNLGWYGIFLMPFLITILLKIIDSITKYIPVVILVVPIITTSLSLISSSLFTVLLTHGLILLSVFLFLINEHEKMCALER